MNHTMDISRMAIAIAALCLIIVGCSVLYYYGLDLESRFFPLERGGLGVGFSPVDWILTCHNDVECMRGKGIDEYDISFYKDFAPMEGFEYYSLSLSYVLHDGRNLVPDELGRFFLFQILSVRIVYDTLTYSCDLDTLHFQIREEYNYRSAMVEPIGIDASKKRVTLIVDYKAFIAHDSTLVEDTTLTFPFVRKRKIFLDKH